MASPRPSPSRVLSSDSPLRPPTRDRGSDCSSAKQQDMSTPQNDQVALPGLKEKEDEEEAENSSSDELALDTALTSRIVSRGERAQGDEPSRKRVRIAPTNAAAGNVDPKTKPISHIDGGNMPDQANDDDPVADAYAPLSSRELEDSESWVDFDSDEHMFNGILEKFGISGLEVMPIFSLQPDSVVNESMGAEFYGMIACVPTFSHEGDPTNVPNPDPHELWFAKQHWGLACGTIALLHVLMNQDQVYIGDMLFDFQRETEDRDKYAKGVMLDQHRIIRAAHNMFSTRYEHLEIGNSLQKSSVKDRRAHVHKEKGPYRHPRENAKSDDYHFVAYIPHQNHVWALDGLKENPRRVGVIDHGAHWWQGALTEINARWGNRSMTLLGVISNGLHPVQQALAQIAFSFTLFKHTYVYAKLRRAHPELEGIPVDVDDPASLDRVGLSLRFVHAQGPSMSQDDLRKARGDFLDGEDPYEWYSRQCHVAATKQSEYHDKYEAKSDARRLRAGHLEQWGPAVHLWIKKLVSTDSERFRRLVLGNQLRTR